MVLSDEFVENYAPIENEFFDKLLEKGFYRTGNHIFTTDYIYLEEKYLDVFWLRTNVQEVKLSESSKKILYHLKKFEVIYRDAEINDEVENLYSLYRKHVNFNTSSSAFAYLHGYEYKQIFNSKMVEIRDKNSLIATGFFDVGLNSLAGILNIYHPDYKKYSLGKLLMLLKYQYALQNNFSYYYTGYFALQNPKFDYKFFPDKNAIQVYIQQIDQWMYMKNLNKQLLYDFKWGNKSSLQEH
jgi:arginine-tRNA-protein transferase